MKLKFTCVLAFLALKSALVAQTCTAVPVVTLNNVGSTPMEVAFNPFFNLYYTSSGGGGCNTLGTYSITGGSAINSVSECYDARGSWWNSNTNVLEGNSYNSAGIYTMALNGLGIPTGVGAIAAANSQPNSQTGGQYDPTTNQVLYYNGSFGIAKYNRVSPGALITTVNITGLPGGIGSISTYGFYTGIPGSEYAIYDYTNRRAYLVNYTTGVYVSTVQFPPSAGQPGNYMLSYTNGLYFINNGSIWVGFSAGINITKNPYTPLCSGNSATLTAVAGNNYTWAPGGALTSSIVVSPTVTSNYTVSATPTVGCPSSMAITVSVTPGPTVSVSGSTLICGSGTNILTASGANTYSWNTGAVTATISASPSVTTNYTVIGTSTLSGCANTQTTSITVSPNVTVAVTGSIVICNGQTTNLTASGANSYSWSNGAATATVALSPTATTAYTVIGTNTAGCTGANMQTVTVNPAPTVSVTGAATICTGQSATLNASGANTYSWSNGGITSSIVISPTVTTTYTAVGTNSVNGCTGMNTAIVTVDPCTGLKINTANNINNIYPNPSNGIFIISLNYISANTSVEIHNILGTLVKRQVVTAENSSINIQNEANGIYFVRVLENNKVILTSKIVKQ